MTNKDFFAALADLERERGISEDVFLGALSTALASAYKRLNEGNSANVDVQLNPERCTIRFFYTRTVVDAEEAGDGEITLQDAKLEKKSAKVGDVLSKEFVPKEKITIPSELHSILKGSESVSIHVRRGDYVKANRAMNAAYYKKAIRLIKKSYKDPYFIVFSDDLAWTKENLILNERCIYVNENKALNDY